MFKDSPEANGCLSKGVSRGKEVKVVVMREGGRDMTRWKKKECTQQGVHMPLLQKDSTVTCFVEVVVAHD